MGEKIRYIIIAKQCEVAGTSSILDGCLKKSFFGHPSRINDVPCNLTQFCYTPVAQVPWDTPVTHCDVDYNAYNLQDAYWGCLHIPCTDC